MALAKDITNKRYNRLIAIKFSHKQGTFHHWIFKCTCGELIIANKNAVIFGNTQSCGCLQKQRASEASKTHGLRKSRFYRTWTKMKVRCLNPNYHETRYYGAKGIRVSENWVKFEGFMRDMYKSYKSHVKKFGEKQTTIDRINSNGNYCYKNCRWATYKEQASNKNYLIKA